MERVVDSMRARARASVQDLLDLGDSDGDASRHERARQRTPVWKKPRPNGASASL